MNNKLLEESYGIVKPLINKKIFHIDDINDFDPQSITLDGEFNIEELMAIATIIGYVEHGSTVKLIDRKTNVINMACVENVVVNRDVENMNMFQIVIQLANGDVGWITLTKMIPFASLIYLISRLPNAMNDSIMEGIKKKTKKKKK